MKCCDKMLRYAAVALACLALFALCIVIGAARNANLPPEKFLDVDVDGHKLHMLVAGELGPYGRARVRAPRRIGMARGPSGGRSIC